MGLPVAARADNASASPPRTGETHSANHADVQAQIQALQAQVDQLKRQQNSSVHSEARRKQLDQQRAEENNKIVQNVMNELRSRSLLSTNKLGNTPMTAGYNGKHFYLSSPDDKFRLGIEGQLDFRYIYNHSNQNGANVDENVQGFQLRRAKLGFFGNVLNKDLTYKFKGAFSRSSGNFELEDAWLAYQFADDFQVKAGQFTEPFLREFIVSSSAQQAVERSLVTNYFTGEFTKGITLAYKGDPWRLVGGVTGGPGRRNTDFNDDVYEYALLGRADFLVAGTYDEFKDFAAFSKDPFGLLLGAGVNYAKGANGPFSRGDALKYTADVSAKFGNGVNVFAALEGQHVTNQGDPTIQATDQIGVVAQAGAFVIPDRLDVFGRYEYANLDGAVFGNSSGQTSSADTPINLITVGSNYYLHGHAAKFTFDVVYALDQLPVASSGLGLVPDMKRGQAVGRVQFQLLF